MAAVTDDVLELFHHELANTIARLSVGELALLSHDALPARPIERPIVEVACDMLDERLRRFRDRRRARARDVRVVREPVIPSYRLGEFQRRLTVKGNIDDGRIENRG